jgi:hypothetical protein
MKGKKHNAESKAKISASRKGKKHTAESKAKMSGKNHHRYDHTVRTIKHPIHGKVTGTRQGMLAEFPEMKPSGLSGLLSGDRPTYLGWKLK